MWPCVVWHSQNGTSPLHLASFNGHMQTVAGLVEARADIGAVDKVLMWGGPCTRVASQQHHTVL